MVVESTADKTLGIKDSVVGLALLVLSGITDKTFVFREGNIGRGNTVTLVIGNNFHTVVFSDTNTRVGSPKINTDGTFELFSYPLVFVMLKKIW